MIGNLHPANCQLQLLKLGVHFLYKNYEVHSTAPAAPKGHTLRNQRIVFLVVKMAHSIACGLVCTTMTTMLHNMAAIL